MSDSADELSARLGPFANLPSQILCEQLFASPRSVRRWKQTDRVPALVRFVLELLHYGELKSIARAFEGWALRNGMLHAPNGWKFTPGELLSIPMLHQQLAALRRERDALAEQLTRASLAKAPACSTRRKSLTLSHGVLFRSLREDEHAPRSGR